MAPLETTFTLCNFELDTINVYLLKYVCVISCASCEEVMTEIILVIIFLATSLLEPRSCNSP